jgi:dolichol-phosphate mannosyltransferase
MVAAPVAAQGENRAAAVHVGGDQAPVASGRAAIPDQDRSTQAVTLDVVIPVHNEAVVLPTLLGVIGETFGPGARTRHRLGAVQCIFVDDGSEDESVRIIQSSNLPGIAVRIVRLSRNFGHQAAVSAGIAHSTADLVAVLDADLQDPPPCVLDMVEKWREGFEIVYAQRQNREERRIRVTLYWLFYRMCRLLTPIDVPLDAGDFCLMSRRAVDELTKLPERLRFPRGLRAWIGSRQPAITYDRPARFAGRSSYSWADLYALATDGIAALSLRPLQLAQILALVYFLLTVVGLSALVFGWLRDADLNTRLTVLVLVTMVSNGLVMFCLYIIGAYLGRTYLEVKGRPTYVVADVLDANEPCR